MTSQIHEDDTFPFRDVSSLSDASSLIDASHFRDASSYDASSESSSMMMMSTSHDPLFKGSALRVLKGHISDVMDVAFIPGTRLLVTCSEDNSIRIWDLDMKNYVRKPLLGQADGVRRVAASPDGHWIVSGGGKGSILVWEVATKKSVPVSFDGHEDYVWSVVFAPDSETFASASEDGTVCVWKRETGEKAFGPLKVGSLAYSVSYSPDGTKLAAGTNEHIIIWNAATGEELLKIEQRAFRIAFTPDGLHLVSGDLKDIRISNSTTGDIVKKFDAHTTTFLSLAIAPNGTKFATTSHDGTTRFFDLITFEPIGEPLKHPNIVFSVAFSEDSQLIATGCADKHVRIWTVPLSESEKELQQQKTIPNLLPPDDGLPPRFFDDVYTNYPPHRSNHLPYGVLQRSTPQSRIMALVNHLPFCRQSQQVHSPAGHLHHPKKVTQFLQHLPFRRSIPSPGQPRVVDVAAGRGTERVVVVSVPHYKKVNDTRRPVREEPMSHDTAQSDTTSVISYTDSIPNVHWFMAFLCYLSCWSDGRLRMPPRWDLEPAQSSHRSNGGEAHARS